MAVVDVSSWPCPVDETKTASLILTEERLFYSLRAEGEELTELAQTASDSMIEAALPKGARSIAVSAIRGLRLGKHRNHFQIEGTKGRTMIAFGDEQLAAKTFRSLADSLGMKPVREERVGRFESLVSPICCLVIVLLGGSYLGVLANQVSAPAAWLFQIPYGISRAIGASAIWGTTVMGVLGCLVWMARRLKNPARLLVARRPLERPQDPPREVMEHREGELRSAMAALLGIEATALRHETSFHDDLKIPPGELLQLLGELEERIDLDVSGQNFRTFGDLLNSLKK